MLGMQNPDSGIINEWKISAIALLDDKSQIDAILLDFSKAFDKVSHRRLLYKLDRYGVRGQTLTWISAFLSGCSQRVVCEGYTPPSAAVISGVPQGTVPVSYTHLTLPTILRV